VRVCVFHSSSTIMYLPPKTAWDVRLSFHPPTSPPTHFEALLPSGRRPRAEDAKLRDRSAPDVCPIAILRGLLL